uniref:Uncharacterized protein n=3 Tax=Lygus hesperus TaxID=30085 RepID=A0A0K8T4B7_LYGHE
MTEVFYVAVKGSLHSGDSSVFGIKSEEYSALCRRFPDSNKQVINGVLIKGSPLEVINSLAELGYRVTCSSGETEIVWTLRREALVEKLVSPTSTSQATPLLQPREKRVSPVLAPQATAPLQPGENFVSPYTASQATPPSQQADTVAYPITSPQPPTPLPVIGRPFVVQPPMTRAPVKTVERIGTKPEDWQDMPEVPDRITAKHISSLEKIDPGQKIILKTNLSSEFNPLSKRPGPRGGPYVVVPVSRGRPSQDDTPFPAPPPAPSQSTPAPQEMSHIVANPSVTQTLDEMDFERGLWYPAMQGDLAQIDKILAKGVDVNSTDKSGYTPLHYAVRTGDISVVRKLLKAGANVNLKTKAGQATPLHRAAAAGHSEVVKLLLEHGAEKVPLDSDGRTPLHRSAEAGHEGVSLLLLRATPHAVNVRDAKGLLAADLARGSLGTIIRDNSSTDGASAAAVTPASRSSSKGRTKSVSPVRTAAAASIASPASDRKDSPRSSPKSRSNSPKKS